MKTLLFLVALVTAGYLWADDNHQPVALGEEKLGKVSFPVSCTPAAQEQFNRAIAMLHSFWYDEAEKTFRQVAVTDPNCAMADWGIAMSLYRQLWATSPTAEELQKGQEALQKAKALEIKTEREKAYLTAVEALYRDDAKIADYSARKLAYEKSMAQVFSSYPEDLEANVFYALALISTASPKDKTYGNQNKALSLLHKVLEIEPNHPGVVHYIIHSSDYPELAKLGLDAARTYAQIAPAIPHALHMPSHIFIRLGLWQDAAQSNLAAYAAAKKYALKNFPGKTWDQQLHYMDYLIYAYLQEDQPEKAKGIWQEAATIGKTHPENTTSAYALAAIPARYTLERKAWPEAARLQVRPTVFPWYKFGWCEAIVHFARGLGAARSGDTKSARDSLKRLEALRDAERAAGNEYATDQIEIQRLAVAAWIAHVEKHGKKAEKLMRTSADLEDSTEKDNVTPGAIIPARELLGELLMELKRPDEALQEFEASLQRTPNRRNGKQGAGQAAKLASRIGL